MAESASKPSDRPSRLLGRYYSMPDRTYMMAAQAGDPDHLLDCYHVHRPLAKFLKTLRRDEFYESVCDVTSIERLCDCSRREAISLMKDLARTGVFVFKNGRRRFKSRIEWVGGPRGATKACQELNQGFALLAEKAAANDENAIRGLRAMAITAGIDQETVDSKDWTKLVQMLAPGEPSSPARNGAALEAQNDTNNLAEHDDKMTRPRANAFPASVVLSLSRDFTEREAKFGELVRSLLQASPPSPGGGGSVLDAFKALHEAGGSGWDAADDPAKFLEEVTGK